MPACTCPRARSGAFFALACVRTIPFKGIKGRDGMLFDMVWTKANFVGNEVVVDVNGFDPKKDYVCEYVDEANANIKKITDSKFLDSNKYVPALNRCSAGAHVVGALPPRLPCAVHVRASDA